MLLAIIERYKFIGIGGNILFDLVTDVKITLIPKKRVGYPLFSN